jgi:NAD(P)-dependent dehydrogenase (short-subunit alcohol dehydrogenase family)
LAADRGVHVLCAGRDRDRIASTAREVAGGPVLLDLADLSSVRAAAADLPHVDAVVCNAGLQVLRGTTTTRDGFETTFQVNHLAHLALVDALLGRSAPPSTVVMIGSATHDPAIRTGTPDPVEDDDLDLLSRSGRQTESPRTAGMRRYVTSKLLIAATAAALARQHPGVHVTCFDPGMMPGTGLARDHAAPVRAVWSTALKGLRVLPFASSPAASARALAGLICKDPPLPPSGSYVNHRLQVVPASARARDVDYQDSVLRRSRRLLDTAR